MFSLAEEKVQLVSPPIPVTPVPAIVEINRLDQSLLLHFKDRLQIDLSLSRSLVSFQANKTRSGYRWYKYKEAFSAALIESLLDRYKITVGKMLDPFAGSGTALFVASAVGLQAEGIELLPIGQQIILTRKLFEESFSEKQAGRLRKWIEAKPWQQAIGDNLPELRITCGAYSPQTHEAVEGYLTALHIEDDATQTVLRFALLCVLENVSYTRKDGQYLRWDHRSGRKQGPGFLTKAQSPISTARLSPS